MYNVLNKLNMKMHQVKFLFLIASVAVVFSSCLDTDQPVIDYDNVLAQNLASVNKTQLAADEIIIEDSLELFGVNLTEVKIDPKGRVRYTIQQLGTGAKPTVNSVINVKYKGRLLKNGPDGVVFDENDNLEYYLRDLIMGWQTALPLLPNGTKATLYIPSGVAYGPVDVKDQQGDIVIPKNSNLIFEIELINVR